LNRCSLIPAAWLLDQLAGDPEWLPHPVRLIGFATARGEVALRRPNQSELSQLVSGGTLRLAVVATSYYATRQLFRLANRLSPAVGNTVEVLLAWTCLAERNLEQEATSIVDALVPADATLDAGRLFRADRRGRAVAVATVRGPEGPALYLSLNSFVPFYLSSS
jgi:adenosylcobinamide-phosphate synthase